jgi:hypothetical protein
LLLFFDFLFLLKTRLFLLSFFLALLELSYDLGLELGVEAADLIGEDGARRHDH